jgi:hypothetical protein
MGLWRNLVAQLLCMQKVTGSTPVSSTKEIHTATKYILMVRTKRISIILMTGARLVRGGLTVNQVYGVKSYGGLSPSFGSKYCLVAELVNALHS